MVVFVVLAATLAAAVVNPAPAAAALPRCDDASIVGNSGGASIVPTQGTNTGQTNCALGFGDHSLGVLVLQQDLNYCYQLTLTEDGIYGRQTRDTVVFAQAVARNNGAPIVVDGWYGPQTATYAIKFRVGGGPNDGRCAFFLQII
jgi:peptidoglycan hydrolase-like protein with peptidoglycan-binding domain